jgi:hypothetical protein
MHVLAGNLRDEVAKLNTEFREEANQAGQRITTSASSADRSDHSLDFRSVALAQRAAAGAPSIFDPANLALELDRRTLFIAGGAGIGATVGAGHGLVMGVSLGVKSMFNLYKVLHLDLDNQLGKDIKFEALLGAAGGAVLVGAAIFVWYRALPAASRGLNAFFTKGAETAMRPDEKLNKHLLNLRALLITAMAGKSSFASPAWPIDKIRALYADDTVSAEMRAVEALLADVDAHGKIWQATLSAMHLLEAEFSALLHDGDTKQKLARLRSLLIDGVGGEAEMDRPAGHIYVARQMRKQLALMRLGVVLPTESAATIESLANSLFFPPSVAQPPSPETKSLLKELLDRLAAVGPKTAAGLPTLP